MGDRSSFDAIVIGSGFGGAVTACRLAQAGVKVCILERGRRYSLTDLPTLPRDGQTLPDTRRWTWLGSHGLWDMRNLDGVSVAQSAAYGGGSLVYANVHLRPPTDVFDAEWPADCQNRAGLEEYFDLVGKMLDIKPVPKEWRDSGKVKVMADAFRDTARGLGRGDKSKPGGAHAADGNVFYPPLAIKFPDRPVAKRDEPPPPEIEAEMTKNASGRAQGECRRCGACDFGCRYGAKNTLDRNYLAIAENGGPGLEPVTVKTLCEALMISPDPRGKGYRVTYADHLIGSRGTLTASYVFLCGGSVNTTELLLRCFEQKNPQRPELRDDTLGAGLDAPPNHEVGKRYFVNADAPAMIFGAKEETHASEGPVITTALVYKRSVDSGAIHKLLPDRHKRRGDVPDRKWFLIQDGGYPKAVEKLFSIFQSPLLMGRNGFDPGRILPSVVTIARAAAKETRPDRYASFIDGFAAALVDGTLPNVLPGDFNTAATSLLDLAGKLRDAEIGDLAEEVRDAVVLNSPGFRFLKWCRVNKWWPWSWKKAHALTLWLMSSKRPALLKTTLDATHGRYGVDEPSGLLGRAAHLLLGEPYPVNPTKSAFGPLHGPEPVPKVDAPRAMLLAMGRDDVAATLELVDGRVQAHFPGAAFPTLGEEERVMRGIADQLGGTLRTSPLWALARRPLTAHSHGGCTLGKVTDEWGEVRGLDNLFINDGALLPRPVGVNPSSTIAAVAERNIKNFVLKRWYVDQKILSKELPASWEKDIADAKEWSKRQEGVDLEPPKPATIELSQSNIGFSFVEAMAGYLAPCQPGEPSWLPGPGPKRIPLARFLSGEQNGRAAKGIASFKLNARVDDIGAFLEDPNHPIPLDGPLDLGAGLLAAGQDEVTVKIVGGSLNLLVDGATERRLMLYHLPFDFGGKSYTLVGHKEIQDDPGFDAWLDASTLYTELWDAPCSREDFLDAGGGGRPQPRARGILRLGLRDFLTNQIQGLHAEGTKDPLRTIWTLGSFGFFFFGELQGMYAPEIARFRDLFGKAPWQTAVAAPGAKPPRRSFHGLKGL